eukprot:5773221-Prymnesium_polylepis.2
MAAGGRRMPVAACSSGRGGGGARRLTHSEQREAEALVQVLPLLAELVALAEPIQPVEHLEQAA